jgi:hypothetical protein
MRSTKLTISFVFVLAVSLLQAQNGYIRGTVFDEATGESLPGVQIIVVGTSTGTLSDLDGKFNISIQPGTHNISLSYVSYETLKIEGLVVESGEVNLLDNIFMSETALELGEVTITAQAVRNTENALFTIKRKSANVIDGISSANFKKIGDSDAASSMKRVTGVSVEGGKYVYVRGLGDRYTKTILNGVDIPGLDPDRNSLQMDLFPTNIIDNIIVHKSFSADLPADFTGGVIDINTKDFPEDRIGSISASVGYNPDMHFRSDFLTYNGSATDFLGFDDGKRKIPADDTEYIPSFVDALGNENAAQRFRQILEGFDDQMGGFETMSFMDYSLGFSIGNQKPKEKVTLGYNFSISYKNETELFRDSEYGTYGIIQGQPDNFEMESREFQRGDYGVNSVLLSGLAGFAVKTLNSKYRITLMHLQNGESTAGTFDYEGKDQGSVFNAVQYNLDYNQRSLTNILLAGDHKFNDAKWEVEWKVSPTLARMDDPDVRFTRYEPTEGGGWLIGTEVGFPERIWRDLDEINLAGIVHVTHEFDIRARKSNVKFGGAYTYKDRDYNIMNYGIVPKSVPLTGNPNELFWEENLWPRMGDDNEGTTYDARFIPNNPNKYNSYISYAAAYASTDLWLFNKFKAILGLRLEQYTQWYTGTDQLQEEVLDNEKVLDELGLFPSVNFVYTISDNQNIRLSYSKTIARPSFKELSYAEIYDPITGRTFIGGLHDDVINNGEIVYWDGNLITTDIHNFDLRWELYQERGQMFSLSAFYKRFLNPIEIVQFSQQPGAFQPRNVGDGKVLGAEAEVRFNFGTFTPTLENFKILFNFTITESRIKMSTTELLWRTDPDNLRTGQTVDEYREMAGQSPYIINGGFTYDGGQTGFWRGFEAGIFYNMQSTTLTFIGINDRPDIYTKPFHSMNFNTSKKFGQDDRMRLALRIENILNDDIEIVYQSFKAQDQYFERHFPGMHFKVSFSYNIY